MPSIRHPQNADDLCAIFVHAGAGFHSISNEKYHLAAVNDAAKVGMTILKNGGDATDAVEMAIRLLEDREITNAGYGSNLTMEGLVECDACMVDHLGRSGGVGAVSQIRNPIALARLVLDESTKPLSLQRVPPNLLVGSGAADFGASHGVPIVAHDYLVSDNARDRWLKWRQDLSDAARGESTASPRSPPRSDSVVSGVSSSASLTASNGPNVDSSSPFPSIENNMPTGPPSYAHQSNPQQKSVIAGSTSNQQPPTTDPRGSQNASDTQVRRFLTSKRRRVDGSCDTIDTVTDDLQHVSLPITPSVHVCHSDIDRPDDITDTVGAIAVDCFGRIAAGSSSGGIGMKHKGRCGPAALVGVGTAVIPIDPEDPERTSVAAVASGTGEHMATTTAAALAADRVYNSVQKTRGRTDICTEDEAIHSFIKNDFMKHPGVQISPCTGAIGILVVKKSKAGIYFYFGHNTESFALASMHGREKKPVCTMSRSKGDGAIAQGGRVCRAQVHNRH